MSKELSKKQKERLSSLMPSGVPKYVRVYDNTDTEHESLDCITVVFTGHYRKKLQNGRMEDFVYLGMSRNTIGFCQHGFAPFQIDKPTYSHLGKKIKFSRLSPECQKAVISTYKSIWDL